MWLAIRLLAAAGLLVIGLAACERILDGWQPLPELPTALPLPTPEPYNVEVTGRHCTEFPLQKAVEQAGVIAVGTVKEVLPARWTTEDGQRPPPPWQFGIPATGIVTPILFEAEEYLKGEEAGAELHFYVGEGAVGQDSIEYGIPILPSLPAGARAVVFLVKQQERFSYEPLWIHLDHYSLTAEGQAVDSCQVASMPQEALFADIRAAVR